MNENGIRFVTLDENSEYLSQVKELGRTNNSTLGFLPEGAYDDFAKRKQVIAAVDNSNKCIGYLLYRISRSEVIIVHLCIDVHCRRKGIARRLLECLISKTRNGIYYGIGLWCRRDYALNNLWKKLGFVPLSDRPGRSKAGKLLTFWWYDYKCATLFTHEAERRKRKKTAVVMDSNVYFNLVVKGDANNIEFEECSALCADWLKPEIELFLTNEIYHEIDRSNNQKVREICRGHLNKFLFLPIDPNEQKSIAIELRKLFNKTSLTSQDESDIQQLAYAIAGNSQFFVTLDPDLLRLSNSIHEKYNLLVVRPSDLIVRYDELKRKIEYQPARLAGSHTKIRLIKPADVNQLVNTFVDHRRSEKGKDLKKLLYKYLSLPNTYKVEGVFDNEPKALLVVEKEKKKIIDIPLFRVKENTLSKTLAEHLILQTILDFSKGKSYIIKISDDFLSENIKDILQNLHFDYVNKEWIKINLPIIISADNLLKEVDSLSGEFGVYKKYFENLKLSLEKYFSSLSINISDIFKIERKFWPLKIIGIDAPIYIIPIKPSWAMHLFEQKIAEGDIFGSKLSIVINRENVYYRSCKPGNLIAPARILWYVSSDKSRNFMQIRACSYLDEIKTDTPKELFRQYQKIGIYEWRDVYKLAKNNINNKIMAIKFSNTELFKKPIVWHQLKYILHRDAPIQSPVPITIEKFEDIYKTGMCL